MMPGLFSIMALTDNRPVDKHLIGREFLIMYRYFYNFEYNSAWQNRHYAIKQVAPVIVEEAEEIVVITVYTFYF